MPKNNCDTKKCVCCGKEYKVPKYRYDKSKYCSNKCRDISHHKGRERKGDNKKCIVCGKEFYVPKYRSEKAKYCSRNCMEFGQYEHIEKECPTCHKKFFVSNSRINRTYCSIDCKDISKTDQIEKRKLQRLSVRVYRNTSTRSTIRKFVFSEKEKKCELCGYDEYDFNLEIHHINVNPNDNRLENLAVLCAHCHRALHKGKITYKGNYYAYKKRL